MARGRTEPATPGEVLSFPPELAIVETGVGELDGDAVVAVPATEALGEALGEPESATSRVGATDGDGTELPRATRGIPPESPVLARATTIPIAANAPTTSPPVHLDDATPPECSASSRSATSAGAVAYRSCSFTAVARRHHSSTSGGSAASLLGGADCDVTTALISLLSCSASKGRAPVKHS